MNIIGQSGLSTHQLYCQFVICPRCPTQTILPKNWSQTALANKTQSRWASTYHDCVVLHLNNDKFCRTILLDKRSNIARLMTAPGSKHFKAYKSLVQLHPSDIIPICFDENVVHTDNTNTTTHSTPATILASKGVIIDRQSISTEKLSIRKSCKRSSTAN